MTPLESTNYYKQLRNALSDAIRKHDPIGLIALASYMDEDDPEVGTILPLVKEAVAANDMKRILYAEFDRWFDASTTEPESSHRWCGRSRAA